MLASWVIGLIDIRLKQLGIFFWKEEDTYFDITKHLNIFFALLYENTVSERFTKSTTAHS